MVQPTPRTAPTVVVGVVETQPPATMRVIADLVPSWGARVMCAHVDTARFVVGKNLDGSVASALIDPDLEDNGPAPFPDQLAASLEAVFDRAGVDWSTAELAGDPAQALADLAEQVSATMIIVGTRRPGFRGAMAEFFDGSVAVHLAHRQRLPVLVIPQAPSAHGELPWQGHGRAEDAPGLNAN